MNATCQSVGVRKVDGNSLTFKCDQGEGHHGLHEADDPFDPTNRVMWEEGLGGYGIAISKVATLATEANPLAPGGKMTIADPAPTPPEVAAELIAIAEQLDRMTRALTVELAREKRLRADAESELTRLRAQAAA